MHHRIIENNQVEMNLDTDTLLRLSLVNLGASVISNLISLAIVVHQPILVRVVSSTSEWLMMQRRRSVDLDPLALSSLLSSASLSAGLIHVNHQDARLLPRLDNDLLPSRTRGQVGFSG